MSVDNASALPPGWDAIRVRELADSIQYGHTASAVHSTDGPRFLRITDIHDGGVDWNAVPSCEINKEELDKYRLSPGDVVFARTGATTGKSYLIGESPEAVFASYLIRVRVSKAVEPRYLAAFFQSPGYWAQIEKAKRGIGQPNVNGQVLGEVLVPVAPRHEQLRIVDEIDKYLTRLDVGVAALHRAQAQLKRYRAAVLTAACEGRLVPIEAELSRRDRRSYETANQLLERVLLERRNRWSGRGRYAEASLPEGAELPLIPEGWTWTTLDAVAEIKGGITKDQKRKPDNARSVPYLRVANVQRGYLDLSEMKEILATEDEIAELALRPGDVLFNEGGDRDKLGRGWVWGSEVPVCIHQNHVFRARLYDRALQPKFVSWYANWVGQRFFFDEGKHTTNLASISMSKLRLLPIPVPPPAEQLRIVVEVERLLSVIDALEVAVDANMLRAVRLRESILHRAFSGRLSRVHAAPSAPPIAVSPQRRHFARAVLSAEIVTRLHREPTFGRIKHQKIFHLCEHVAHLGDIQGEYHREAAGPLDNRLIYANEAELKKQSWFKTVRREGHGHSYEPMAKVGGHRKYADRYWPTELALIERLIELMRTWKTDRCEIFSTVYAAWNDLILWHRPVTDDAIVHEILNRWHSAKRQIPETRWRKAIQWVRENGFEPTGFGRPTASPE